MPGAGALFEGAKRVLPRGYTLAHESWRRRHRFIVGLLWAHCLGLTVFAIARGYDPVHSMQEGGIVGVAAIIAGWTKIGRRRQSSVAAFGCVLSSAVLVHLSGGTIEAHFHFFIMVAVLSLYQDWVPFLVAIGFVVLHHGIMGVLYKGAVYNHYAAINNPWKWAAIHGLMVLGASAANVAAWRLNEDAQLQVKESEERFRAVFADAAVGQAVSDPDGRLVAANAAFCRITGYSEDELKSLRFLDITHPDDVPRQKPLLERMYAGDIDAFDIEKRYIRKDGTIVHVLNSVSVIRAADGSVRFTAAIVQDITDRTRSERALRDSEERYRGIVETAQEGVWLLDEHGRTTFANERMAQMLGVSMEELVGTSMLDFVHVDDRGAAQVTLDRRGEGDLDRNEIRFVRADGADLWVLLARSPVLDNEGHEAGVLAMVADITERKVAEEALAHQAFHDTLTKLPNRLLFLDRLTHALDRRTRHSGHTAVLFLDVDRFKWVNDSLGHAAGDEVLLAVAERLARTVRPGDSVARFGGDEFVVLCEELADERSAIEVAERVSLALGAPMTVNDHEITLSVSVGIALAPSYGDHTAEVLLRDADAAMYRAKEKGRDRIELFDQEMRSRAVARLETEAALRRAIEMRELRVHYQPVMTVATGRVAGVEALVRWEHPERGLVPPLDFIPLAEDTGLIVPIGAHVLAESCRYIADWNRRHRDREPLSVSVNLSARQLTSPGLTELVSEALRNSGLDPTLLNLEITESVLMEDADTNRAALEALKELGVTISVDDFGTGYSSLLYLRQFPVDVLKVDRSFVAGLSVNRADAAIVTGVLGLARALGLRSVAEGVETVGQAAQLAALGCDLAQGYHWSRPLPPVELEAWLEANEPGKVRVLIVDDKRDQRLIVRLALELEGGFEVVAEAEDGRSAIEAAGTHQPDLVLLDVLMPGMDGIEALPAILGRWPHAKVVLLTALGSETLPEATRSSSHGVLSKALDLHNLAERLGGLTAGRPL